jgi:P4 family phage/plasmid primase-like protien
MPPHEEAPDRDKHGGGDSENTSSVADYSEPLSVARSLIDAGIPVFVAKPARFNDGRWNPDGGHNKCGYWLPPGWQKTEPDVGVLDDYRPSDALGMVCGHKLDGLDTDPRNGGGESRVALQAEGAMPRVYGKAATPSGGTHELVATMGIRSRDNFRAGIDVKAGALDGEGRGFFFIAPTTKRSKVDGTIGEYRWIMPPDLAALAASGPDDRSGEALAALVEALRAPRPTRARNAQGPPQAASDAEVAAVIAGYERAGPWNGVTPDARQQAYLAQFLRNQVQGVASAAPGQRNTRLYTAALKCGSLVAGAGMDQRVVIEQLEQVAASCGLTEDDGEQQVRATISSGLNNGQRNPRAVPASSAELDGDNGPDGDGVQRLEDAHIGQRIADDYLAGRFLHSGAFGWMRFDERRWKPVEEAIVGEVIRRGVIDFHRTEAQSGADAERLRKISGLLSAHRLKAILWVAKGYLSVEDEEFDAHPDLLNVRNGVVDLRDGSLRPHDPLLRFTKVTMVDYKADGVHPDWEQALTAIPTDAVEWLQLRFGQGLSGHPAPDDVLVVLKGAGENGKTTVADALRESVGEDYAVALPDRVLLARNGDHPTELMTLRGARLAFMEEFPELGHLNVKRLKDMHGTGRITARYIGKDSVSWQVTHSMFITTNYLPRVDESDHGTWRRLALVEFPFRYRKPHEALETPNDRHGDPGLRDRLRQGSGGRREAVLAWLVRGATKWYQSHQVMPEPPASVQSATETWRRSADLLLRYMDDNLVLDGYGHVMATELFDDFTDWLRANGHKAWTDQNFSARLGQHPEVVAAGIEKMRGVRSSRPGLSHRPRRFDDRPLPKQYAAWLGLRFRTRDDQIDLGDEGSRVAGL